MTTVASSQTDEDRQKPGEKRRGAVFWEVMAGDGGDKQTDEDRQKPGEKRRGAVFCDGW